MERVRGHESHKNQKAISRDWLVIMVSLLHDNHLDFVCKELEDMNLAKGHFIRKGISWDWLVIIVRSLITGTKGLKLKKANRYGTNLRTRNRESTDRRSNHF